MNKSFWSCVRTHPSSEKIAIRNLINQDFNYYQPLILERKLRRNKIQLVEQPLFPCYLFVQIVDRWNSLKSTHGIASIIQAGPMPARIDNSIIDDLRKREMNGYIQLPKSKRFEVGDQVTINAGAFTGQQALVERMNSKERQQILLALLDNKIRILIDENDIAA